MPLPQENRALSKLPKFKRKPGGLKKYLTGHESYFADHFGFRTLLVRGAETDSCFMRNARPSMTGWE
jgi:hypothetical protein